MNSQTQGCKPICLLYPHLYIYPLLSIYIIVLSLGGATPLHRAAYSGHLDIVNLLLHHGADPSIVDSDGMTSLHKVKHHTIKQ